MQEKNSEQIKEFCRVLKKEPERDFKVVCRPPFTEND